MMSSFKILFLLTILWMHYAKSSSACTNWTSISPPNYSRTYVDVTSANANTVRPLGFMSATVVFGSLDKPCVIVQNTTGNGRHYVLNVDSGSGQICAEMNGQTECYSDDATTCGTVTTARMTFKFDCQSCEGSSATFWYRIVLEEADADTGSYNENWCQTRTAEYPRSLRTTEEVLVIPTPPDSNPGGSAVGIRSSKITAAILAVFAAKAFQF